MTLPSVLAGLLPCVVLAVPLAVPAAEDADPQEDLRAALAKPVSPGSVALLLPFAGAPEARERWAAALRDGRAETRAATGRVVSVAAVASLLPDVLTALKVEADEDAARELLRAAFALGGPSVDTALFAATVRLGVGRLSNDLIDLLGRR